MTIRVSTFLDFAHCNLRRPEWRLWLSGSLWTSWLPISQIYQSWIIDISQIYQVVRTYIRMWYVRFVCTVFCRVWESNDNSVKKDMYFITLMKQNSCHLVSYWCICKKKCNNICLMSHDIAAFFKYLIPKYTLEEHGSLHL